MQLCGLESPFTRRGSKTVLLLLSRNTFVHLVRERIAYATQDVRTRPRVPNAPRASPYAHEKRASGLCAKENRESLDTLMRALHGGGDDAAMADNMETHAGGDTFGHVVPGSFYVS